MTFRSRSVDVNALQFDGSNIAAFRDLLAEGAVTVERSHWASVAVLRTPSRPDRVIHKGDWVCWDGQVASVFSNDAFTSLWEQVPEDVLMVRTGRGSLRGQIEIPESFDDPMEW